MNYTNCISSAHLIHAKAWCFAIIFAVIAASAHGQSSRATADSKQASHAATFTAVVPNGTVGLPTEISARYAGFSNKKAGKATVSATITGSNPQRLTLVDKGSGLYSASYTPANGGIDLVTIRIGGVAIKGSPYRTTVTTLNQVIAALANNDVHVRTEAADLLVKVGEPSVQPLIATLVGLDSDAAAIAYAVLIKIGGPAVEHLIAALDDADSASQDKIVEVLGLINDPRAVSALKYEEVDTSQLALVFSANVRSLTSRNGGQDPDPRFNSAIDADVTRFSVASTDIELVTSQISADSTEPCPFKISTKHYGTIRLGSNGDSFSLWLMPSQKRNLMKLVK